MVSVDRWILKSLVRGLLTKKKKVSPILTLLPLVNPTPDKKIMCTGGIEEGTGETKGLWNREDN